MTTATADPPQHMAALRRANEIRFRRADLKRDLHALPTARSRQLAAEVIVDPPDWAESMRVQQLLSACRSTGPAFLRRIVRKAGVSAHERLGDLSLSGRARLAVALRGPAQERRS